MEKKFRKISEVFASIPDIQSAMKIGGDGSMRLQLDIPASEIAEYSKLIAFGRNKALKVFFTEEGNGQ